MTDKNCVIKFLHPNTLLNSIEDKIKQMCGDAFEWMDCSSIKFQRRGASRALKKSRIWKKNAPEVGDQTRLVRGNAAKRLDQIF